MTNTGSSTGNTCDVLAVASTGGHWTELMLLKPAFEGMHVLFVSTDSSGRDDVPVGAFVGSIPDAYLGTPVRAVACLWRVAVIVRRLRPRVVISTGAAPGLLAVVVGAVLGAKTVWVESLCGVTQLTFSGRLARRFVTRFLVQWPDLAGDGAEYFGSLL